MKRASCKQPLDVEVCCGSKLYPKCEPPQNDMRQYIPCGASSNLFLQTHIIYMCAIFCMVRSVPTSMFRGVLFLELFLELA